MAGFKEFSSQVQRYVQLRQRAAKGLHEPKKSASPESIAKYQRDLATRIRRARPNAREGEIFTPVTVNAFRDVIAAEFKSPAASHARATILEGEPIKNVRIEVNEIYPAALPYTSVPPTLLERLPRLPEEVAYRIVDRDLVLLDVKANLVVDVLTNALP